MVLRQITTSLGLTFTAFESKAVLLNERLFASRNRIAHGEYLLVDEASALELASEVQNMMERYRSLVENAVALGSYRYTHELVVGNFV